MVVKIKKLYEAKVVYGVSNVFFKTIDYVICNSMEQARAWTEEHYPQGDDDFYKLEEV